MSHILALSDGDWLYVLGVYSSLELAEAAREKAGADERGRYVVMVFTTDADPLPSHEALVHGHGRPSAEPETWYARP